MRARGRRGSCPPRTCREPGPDHGPGAAGPPAGERAHADDEREQEHVAERVGEVRDHRTGAALGRVEHDLEEHRGPECGCGQRGSRAVQPDAAIEAGDTCTDEEEEGHVAGRVEGEVEGVGNRREGRLAAVRDREEELAGGPCGQAAGQAGPGGPLPLHQCRAQRAQGEGEQDQAVVDPLVVDPLVEEPVDVRPSEVGERVRGEHDQPRDAEREAGPADPPQGRVHESPIDRRGTPLERGNRGPPGPVLTAALHGACRILALRADTSADAHPRSPNHARPLPRRSGRGGRRLGRARRLLA